jgi:amino acid transporter
VVPASTSGQPPVPEPQLRRVLTLWDLVFYGIVLIQPIAAVPLFGIADKLSRGHVVTTILIAMIAMMLTAFSYGRMATAYPAAGSAYTYVGREINPHLGFLTGWAMMLDYLVIPIINTIYGALTLARLFPGVPYIVWAAMIAALITYLNLRGIRSTARSNIVLLVVMSVVIVAFLILAVRYLVHLDGMKALFSLHPFYDPGKTDFSSIATATSLAALTYIGFDGVTTLSEEVHDPKRNILRATVLVCFLTGVFSGIQVYLAQLVWPDFSTFPNIETAFMDVSRRVGGVALFDGMAFILVVASIGSGLAGQAGAARLLFGMGRDNALPRKLFAHIGPKQRVPTYNIWVIGLIAFLGAMFLNWERAAEVLNFGAFLAFMGVNLAAIRHFYLRPGRRDQRRVAKDLLLPAFGFLFCLWIWWSLPHPAKIVGGAWFVGGIIYDGIITRGFRRTPAMIDFSEG